MVITRSMLKLLTSFKLQLVGLEINWINSWKIQLLGNCPMIVPRYGDFGFCFKHNSLDCATSFTNYSSDKIIVRQNFQWNFPVIHESWMNEWWKWMEGRQQTKKDHIFSPCGLDLPFVSVISFLLHHFQNTTASISAVLRIAVNGNGFFQWADILLPMNVHPTLMNGKAQMWKKTPAIANGTNNSSYRALVCCVICRIVPPCRPMMAPTISLATNTLKYNFEND